MTGIIIGYIRVSTDRQAADNQRFEILKFADLKKVSLGARARILGVNRLSASHFINARKQCYD